MTIPERNRLDEEASPYLLQHADNPVDWQPWDDDALSLAREHDAPIFLSIGYAACHWCHVMEDESFADEEVARALNEGFVPIKVDREERPDVDSLYMTICQLVTGRGGWPLSAWLTPDGRPFYVGTYFPKEPRRGMPGFLELLRGLRDSWETDRAAIEERADQWAAAIEDEVESVPEPGERPGSETLSDAAGAALRAADHEHGGFGQGGPKFPQPARLHLLARAYDRTGRESYLAVLGEALDAMSDRGLYDHVGGGFHRYATDREWIVPHFEKMLYDNAEIPRALIAGHAFTGEEHYARVVEETIEFLDRELSHPDGGFYSTLDAQSLPPGTDEGAHQEEGAFYVWTPDGVRDVLDEDADLFCERYGITEGGNFDGKTVLALSRSIPELAEEHGQSDEDIETRLEAARERIFEAREERPRPARDEKVLASWNGLAISTLAEAGLALDSRHAERAVEALSFCREQLWDESERELSRRFKDGDVRIDGYLDDYAFLARGAFDCYRATGEVSHLSFALDLARVIEDRFWEAEERTIYFTGEGTESLVARPQERHDQSTPSSLGVAADVLLSLSQFAPDEGFEPVVEGVLSTQGSRIRTSPLEHATLVLVADRFENGALELTIAADELPHDWHERIGREYLPDLLLAPRPPTEEGLAEWVDVLGLEETPPIWADRGARDGEPTVYACRSFTCSPPTHDIEEAFTWAAENVRS
ncbi:thioredoxin domain-containing protein [Natronorarus salvus]|uniref:thioredoxin domain-containing protein n=1 Tax=Natronorarus salvus TaxID=3117733 RepID=UPI002F2601F0